MRFWKILSAMALSAALLCSCDRGEMGFSYTEKASSKSKVLVLYAPAASNLSRFIKKNVDALARGILPYEDSRKAILIYTHLDSGDSHLYKLSSDDTGNPVRDTLLTVAPCPSASDPAVISEVLGAVCEAYPPGDNSYTLIMSSHGTGWLPSGAKEKSSTIFDVPGRRKAFGSEKIGNTIYEISIQDLAAAIPMYVDCLVFDACLMGCVEVAWELRGKVGKLCCSPAEVPGNGYIYSDIGTDLLSDSASPESFSRAFYEHYKTALETGNPAEDSMYGVTSTTVDCSRLQPLADICTELFEKYRSQIAALQPDGIQHYYRVSSEVDYYRDFFDLQDILIKAGITLDENRRLQDALDGCISFKGATKWFMKNNGGFDIKTYCGLSMHLPSRGYAELDAFYKTLGWNKATKLVE